MIVPGNDENEVILGLHLLRTAAFATGCTIAVLCCCYGCRSSPAGAVLTVMGKLLPVSGGKGALFMMAARIAASRPESQEESASVAAMTRPSLFRKTSNRAVSGTPDARMANG